jgi:hypothetical protein
MRRRLVGGIYIVQAAKDGVTEYWAATTLQENAVAAVEKELGPGWTVTLTDRRLTNQPSRHLVRNSGILRSSGIGGATGGADHIVSRQRPPDPLQLELTDRLNRHGVLNLCQNPSANQDLPGLRFIA